MCPNRICSFQICNYPNTPWGVVWIRTAMLTCSFRLAVRRPTFSSFFHSSAVIWATKKSIKQFKLADIGEGITECEVIKWLVMFRPKCQGDIRSNVPV